MATARHVATIATGIAFLALPAPSAWAQALDIPMIVTGAHGTNTWASLNYAHQFETDIDDTATEMERDSVQLIAGHRFQMTDDLFLVGNVSYQGSY